VQISFFARRRRNPNLTRQNAGKVGVDEGGAGALVDGGSAEVDHQMTLQPKNSLASGKGISDRSGRRSCQPVLNKFSRTLWNSTTTQPTVVQ
jgi:hypothetical protein